MSTSNQELVLVGAAAAVRNAGALSCGSEIPLANLRLFLKPAVRLPDTRGFFIFTDE
jgi:hypothetical protein